MQNPFKNLWGALQTGGGSVIGIDIGSAYMKLVQLRRKNGQAVLETYGELALGPYAGASVGSATNLPVSKLVEALRDIVRESRVTTQDAAIAIPLTSSLLTIIPMPSLDPKEFGTMVPIEARKYVPTPISEVNLNWWILPKEAASAASALPEESSSQQIPSADIGTVDVLIAAIHNEALRRFEDIGKGAKLNVSFFEIEVFSTMRSALIDSLDIEMIIDLGAGESKVFIIDAGLVRFSHTINQGAQDLTVALSRALSIPQAEAEELKRRAGLTEEEITREAAGSLVAVVNFIFSEANRVLLAYQRRSGRQVQRVMLAGGGANLRGLLDYAGQSFGVPVERAQPFDKVEAPAFVEELLDVVGPEFSVAIGIALRKLEEMG